VFRYGASCWISIPQQLVNLLDLSYLEDVLTSADALSILENQMSGRAAESALCSRVILVTIHQLAGSSTEMTK